MTLHELRVEIQAVLPARDSPVWKLSFYGGLLTFIVAEFPDLVPDEYEKTLMRLGVFLSVVGGKMGWSWAGKPDTPAHGKMQA